MKFVKKERDQGSQEVKLPWMWSFGHLFYPIY